MSPVPPTPRIAHLITDLNGFGGTENTLLRYLQHTRIPLAQQMVVVLRSAGEGDTIGAQIRRTGVALHELHLDKGQLHPRALFRLWRLLREFRPSCISAWLYHPILLSAALGLLLPACRQAWHIRSLPFTPAGTHGRRQRVVDLVARLTRWGRHPLLTNSDAAREAHVAIGFRDSGWTVIANGIDFDRLSQARAQRQAMRARLGLADGELLLATVGRYCPEKGHAVLAEALQRLKTQLPAAQFERLHWMGVGNLVDTDNEPLVAALQQALPAQRLHLMGKRADIPELLSAADLFVLPSISESFPNALIEALGAGVYPVSSNVGGVRELGLPAACLAEPGDPASLARALEAALALPAQTRQAVAEEWQALARARFDIQGMAHRFDQAFAPT